MSTKTSKRRQKRLNTNEEEEVEKTEKKLSPKKIDEDCAKEIIVEEEETKTQNNEEPPKEEENGLKGFEKEIENGDSHEEIKNGIEHEQSADEEMASLVVEEEEINVEEEQKKEEEKEESKEEKNETSPVISSRVTRNRSRNTPQKNENGMDTKITNDVRVNITRMVEPEEEKPVQELESIQEIESETTESELTEKHEEQSETQTEPETPEEQDRNLTNASIFVNLGNDTTKNLDFTINTVTEETASFVENTKDMSYGETLRNLTGRRTLRSTNSPFHRSKITLERDSIDSRKSYIPHISSVKRKNHNDSSEEIKRFKQDDSPGLLGYISSPFRSKSRTELPSSTPKLMSYKFAHSSNVDDVSTIDLEDKVESKKWCSIM